MVGDPSVRDNDEMSHPGHEMGIAPARTRPRIDRTKADAALKSLGASGLPPDAIAVGSRSRCPACGAQTVSWAVTEGRSGEPHPVVMHATELLADSFVCTSCTAGWIENDNQVEPIRWVRPWYCHH